MAELTNANPLKAVEIAITKFNELLAKAEEDYTADSDFWVELEFEGTWDATLGDVDTKFTWKIGFKSKTHLEAKA